MSQVSDYGLAVPLRTLPAPVWTLRHAFLMALLFLLGLVLGYAALVQMVESLVTVPFGLALYLLLLSGALVHTLVNAFEDYTNDGLMALSRESCRRQWSNGLALAAGLVLGFLPALAP